MVHDGEYAIKALALWEARDKVHCDLCKRGRIFRDSDFVKWGVGFVREVLILLTHGAPLHILFHPGPPLCSCHTHRTSCFTSSLGGITRWSPGMSFHMAPSSSRMGRSFAHSSNAFRCRCWPSTICDSKELLELGSKILKNAPGGISDTSLVDSWISCPLGRDSVSTGVFVFL